MPHLFTFLSLMGPLISSSRSASTTSPFCNTSTSPACRFSHMTSRMAPIVSRHSDAPSMCSSPGDKARAISEGQMVFGKSLMCSRRWAWCNITLLWSSSKAMASRSWSLWRSGEHACSVKNGTRRRCLTAYGWRCNRGQWFVDLR
ncbi:hypothetical protein IQ07DRAFT_351300 [Pyrenochaeta sp. DS3sAY3a]|nr:hypothetical protein IQ07DRAFT_351300 [Pyrenochaeta sp. DS3sAY3a]